jgi:toxin ParE1/3/4
MRVRITAAAEADIEEIGNFIAMDNPLRAESFARELVDRCLGLAEHSERYPVFTTVLGREIRRCPFGRYLIFYSIIDNRVEVDRVFHSARDYVRLLFPDD